MCRLVYVVCVSVIPFAVVCDMRCLRCIVVTLLRGLYTVRRGIWYAHCAVCTGVCCLYVVFCVIYDDVSDRVGGG